MSAVRSIGVGIAIITGAVAQVAGGRHAGAGPMHLMFAARGKDRSFRGGGVRKSPVAPGTIAGAGAGVPVAGKGRAVAAGADEAQ